jgi:hypothetical protein
MSAGDFNRFPIGVERRWLNRADERSAQERRWLADFKDCIRPESSTARTALVTSLRR